MISGSADLTCSPLAARTSKAVRLAGAALQLAAAPVAAGGRQVAWHIGRSLVGHALDFDASVLPEAIVASYAAEVEEAMWPVLEQAPDTKFDGHHRQQAMLPTMLGGLQVHGPSATLGLACGCHAATRPCPQARDWHVAAEQW